MAYYNIYWITAISSLVTLYQITVSGSEIIFPQYRNEIISTTHILRMQQLHVFVEVVKFVVNIIIPFAARKMYKHLLLFTMASGTIVLGQVGSVLYFHNIFIYLTFSPSHNELPRIIKFAAHPAAMFGFSVLTCVLFVGRAVWFIDFCLRNKFRTNFIMGRICGMSLKSFQILQFIIFLVVCCFLTWKQYRIFFTGRIYSIIQARDPLYFVTSSIACAMFLGSAILYLFDVIRIYNKMSAKSIRRMSYVLFFLLHLNSPIKSFLTYQEHRLFKISNTALLEKSTVSHITGVIVLLNYCGLILYLRNLNIIPNNCDDINVVKESAVELRLIPRKNLVIENVQPIGSGNTATVYRGSLALKKFLRPPHQTSVAIKVMSDCSDSIKKQVILEELRNMSRVMISSGKHHSNLVEFCGVCFQDSVSIIKPLGAVNIVMELCEKGNLSSYLDEVRKIVQKSVEDGLPTDYSKQMCSWTEQIVDGMEHLSSKKLIHGDLAARNILLDSNLVAKISDFGMSRKLYEYQIYVSKKQKEFPWRWMAPESLDRLEFSSQSDVYSFGVLLFEIFSLGETPWPELIWTSDFVQQLESGVRLPRPRFVSDSLFQNVILPCWEWVPEDRPTFAKLKKLLAGNSDIYLSVEL